MIVPIPRGYAEAFEPKITPLSENQQEFDEFHEWQKSRDQFLEGLAERRPEAVDRKWEKDYFKGQTKEGGYFTGHQTKLEIKPFARE